MSIGEAFGAVLRELRVQRGFSQEELGIAAELSRGYVSQLERAANVPTLTSLFALAAALEVDPSAIVARVEELQPTTVGRFR